MDRNPNRDKYGHFIRKPEIDSRHCSLCSSKETYVKKNGGKDWRYDKLGNMLCKKCWLKHIDYPLRGKSKHEKYNPRRLVFLGKVVLLTWNPRKGVCSNCGIITKTRTDMHHMKYIPCMPWACTVELCQACHDREKWRLGEFKNNTGWYQRLNPSKRNIETGKFMSPKLVTK